MKYFGAGDSLPIFLSMFLISACTNPIIDSSESLRMEGIVYKKKKLVAKEGYTWVKDQLITPFGDSIQTMVLISELMPQVQLAYTLCECDNFPYGSHTCEAGGSAKSAYCFGDCGTSVNAPNCRVWLMARIFE
ncbi:MAG: hypothetical protein AAF489_17045 [Bacteroidota bacterium]